MCHSHPPYCVQLFRPTFRLKKHSYCNGPCRNTPFKHTKSKTSTKKKKKGQSINDQPVQTFTTRNKKQVDIKICGRKIIRKGEIRFKTYQIYPLSQKS